MARIETFTGIGKAGLEIAGLFPIRLHYVYSILKGDIIVKNIESGAFIKFGRTECSSLGIDGSIEKLIGCLSGEIALLTADLIVRSFKNAERMSIPEEEFWNKFKKANPAGKQYKLNGYAPVQVIGIDNIENRLYRHSDMKVFILKNTVSGFFDSGQA